MAVTITNLGYGDFTPSFWLSRIITSLLSLSGIFQTALIVGVLSEALMIPPDEKRILASMEKQRKIIWIFLSDVRSLMPHKWWDYFFPVTK